MRSVLINARTDFRVPLVLGFSITRLWPSQTSGISGTFCAALVHVRPFTARFHVMGSSSKTQTRKIHIYIYIYNMGYVAALKGTATESCTNTALHFAANGLGYLQGNAFPWILPTTLPILDDDL